MESRVHGRTKQLPSNLLSYKDNRCIVDFIIKYAEQNTVTLPGWTSGHWNADNAQHHPTNCTKMTVYDAYKQVIFFLLLLFDMISYYREMPVLFKEFYQIYALRLSKQIVNWIS